MGRKRISIENEKTERKYERKCKKEILIETHDARTQEATTRNPKYLTAERNRITRTRNITRN